MGVLPAETVANAMDLGLTVKQWRTKDGVLTVEMRGRYERDATEVDRQVLSVMDPREFAVAITGTDPANRERFNVLAHTSGARTAPSPTP